MPDCLRFGLPIALLIAAGITLLLIALTPTATHAPPVTVFPATEHHVTTTPYHDNPSDEIIPA